MKSYLVQLALVGSFALAAYGSDSGVAHDDILRTIAPMSIKEALAFLVAEGIPASMLLGEAASIPQRQAAYEIFAGKLKVTIENDEAQNNEYGDLLLESYEYIAEVDTMASLLLTDDIKRCYIVYAAEQLLASPTANTLREVEGSLSRMQLLPGKLLRLRNPEAEQIRTDETMRSTLLDASQEVWYSHGFTNRIDGLYGVYEVFGQLKDSYGQYPSELLKKRDCIAVTYRLLITEQLRVVAFRGFAQFLLRGGRVDDISLSDVSTFYKVIPLNECIQFEFTPLAKRFLTPADVLVIAGRSLSEEPQRVWMKGVLQ